MFEDDLDLFTDEKAEYILVVGVSKGYLLTSIEEKLSQVGFNVRSVYTISDMDHYLGSIKALIVYADEKILANHQFLVYLRDKATEGDFPIFLVGNESEVITIKEIIPPHLIMAEYHRPLNITDMANGIREVLEDHNKQKTKVILAVDDSEVMLRNIKIWLGDKYQVMQADSGVTAIKYITLNRPDLILLDYEMPICDGRQTMEMIRHEKDFADIPIIFLTGKQDRESIMKVMELKPAGYLLKTMKPYEVRKYIDAFFDKDSHN